MRTAKHLRVNPRDLAQLVVDADPMTDLASIVEVAGPGFINVTLDDEFLSGALHDQSLVEQVERPERVVVDYSSPNLAKELHVGHLRSTVIGDSIVRMLQFVGHDVIRQNHVGDWGTQFGKLIAHLDDQEESDVTRSLSDLESMYIEATKRFDQDESFAERARAAVVLLQNNDPQIHATWKRFIDTSLQHMQELYERLDVQLTSEDVRGESAYNEDLPKVVQALNEAGLLVESDGAQCVFLDGFTRKDGSPLPMIVRKSDGGYLYHTTDLATLRYRTQQLNADRILYFTDARQILHFELLFAVARAAQFVRINMQLEHHVFGSVLNADGEPFKTRSGENVLLADIIDEGIARAQSVVDSKSAHLTPKQRTEIATQIAIGAIKYADLSKNRTNDYKFDWDTMLALEGNTSPYLQYAHARIRSIFERGQVEPEEYESERVIIGDPAEHDLAVRLLRMQEVMELSLAECKPHHFCNYLYDLTVHFMRFYESCGVLNAKPSIRQSRLTLCALCARVIRNGLQCLGISAPVRM